MLALAAHLVAGVAAQAPSVDFAPARLAPGVVMPMPPVQALGGGRVLLELAVDEAGQVSEVGVLQGLAPWVDPMLAAVEQWSFAPAYDFAEPNAGLPAYVNGKLAYAAGPEYFSERARHIVASGATLIGGCCGTTPEHIAHVRDAIKGVRPERTVRRPATVAASPAKPERLAVATETGLAAKLAKGEFVVTAELSPPGT